MIVINTEFKHINRRKLSIYVVLSRNFISLFAMKYPEVKCILGLNQVIYDSSTPVFYLNIPTR